MTYHVATVSLDHWMVPTKLSTSSLVCRGRQTTARGGCNVRQLMLQKFLKISIKNSKCAVSNKHIQDGRPGRYENRRGSKIKAKAHPTPRNVNIRHVITQKARESGIDSKKTGFQQKNAKLDICAPKMRNDARGQTDDEP